MATPGAATGRNAEVIISEKENAGWPGKKRAAEGSMIFVKDGMRGWTWNWFDCQICA